MLRADIQGQDSLIGRVPATQFIAKAVALSLFDVLVLRKLSENIEID